MIIDKAPQFSLSQNWTSSSSSSPSTDPQPVQHAALNPFINPFTQPSLSATFEQSPRTSDEQHPDSTPPPYEAVIAAPSPHTSTRQVLRKSTTGFASPSGSFNTGVGVIPQNTARICPLNPTEHLSPCFLRPVPTASNSSVTYERLPRPFVISSKPGASTLADSFATVGTPALYKHDVQEGDWEELLQDVRACARFSSGQQVVSGVLPFTKCLGPPGCLLSFVVAQGMKKQKTSDVAALLDIWNERFFRPRRLEVILCRGDKRKSGRDVGFLAPDRLDTPLSAPSPSSASLALQEWKDSRRRSQGLRSCCDEKRPQTVEKPYRLVVVSA